jgi:hypothetical protein
MRKFWCYNGSTVLGFDTEATGTNFLNFGPLPNGALVRKIIVHSNEGASGADVQFIAAAFTSGEVSADAEFTAGHRVFGVATGVDLTFPGAGTTLTEGSRVGMEIPINHIVEGNQQFLCVRVNRGNVDGIVGVVCVDIPCMKDGVAL